MYHCVYANVTEIGQFLDPRSRNEALFLSQREDEASGAIRSLSYPVTTKLLLKLDVEGVALDRVNDRIPFICADCEAIPLDPPENRRNRDGCWG